MSSVATTTEIEVQITQDDLDKGVRKSCFSCPISLALGREPGVERVSTGTFTVGVHYKDGSYKQYEHTNSSRAFIALIDGGHRLQPQTVRLLHVGTHR